MMSEGLSNGLILVCVAVVVVFWLFTASARPRYQVKPLLSDWERRTLVGLCRAIPAGWHVCPQVRIADFLTAKGGSEKARWAADAKVRQRSVDFLLIDGEGAPRLVIELDDRSHARPDRRRRDAENDAAYEQAGLPVSHIRPGRAPEWSALIAQATTAPAGSPSPFIKGVATKGVTTEG